MPQMGEERLGTTDGEQRTVSSRVRTVQVEAEQLPSKVAERPESLRHRI